MSQRLFLVAGGRSLHLPCPRCGHCEAVHDKHDPNAAVCLDCASGWCSAQIVLIERPQETAA